MTELEKFIKKTFNLTKKELIEKYSKIIIKSGSKVIKQTKDFELVGIRNSRDKKWFLDLMFDSNATIQSVNYQRIRLASGAY